jgi:hypothetical protein
LFIRSGSRRNWIEDLYRTEGTPEEHSQHLEIHFMSPLDDGAAKALERMEAGDRTDWPAEERSRNADIRRSAGQHRLYLRRWRSSWKESPRPALNRRFVREFVMRRSNWAPSIVPRGDDHDVYLVVDDLGRLGRIWLEAADIAAEMRRRCDLQLRDVPTALQDFVDRHDAVDRSQLSLLRLA